MKSNNPILYPPRVLSGVQPTLSVHLGNYFGALKQHIELHHQYPGQTFFLISDYQSLTRSHSSKGIRQETIEIATTYLALGFDPVKATLYRQSDVPECTELAWILSCLVSADKASLPLSKDNNGNSPLSLGEVYYPILMSSDIFCVRATIIPIGEDLRPSVDYACEAGRRFNEEYNTDFFPIPEVRVNKSGIVKGIDARKMSHSYQNTIMIFEPTFIELQRKVNNLRVDDTKGKNEPKDPDNCDVFALYSLVAPVARVELMRSRYEAGISYNDAKRELTLAIQEYFSAYQDRYVQLKRDPDFVADVLREGFKQASEEARYTLDEVRRLTGLAS